MCTRPDSRGEDCASLAERALGDAEVVRERPDSMSLIALAQNLAVLDRVESSRRAIDAGIAAARDRGDEMLFGLWSSQECFRGHLHGELVETEAAGRAVLPMIQVLPKQVVIATAGYLAPVLIDRGAVDEAELILRDALADVRAEKVNVIDLQARRALTHLRTAQRRWTDVAAEAEQIGERLAALSMSGHPNHPWRCAAAIAYAALGEPDRARELLAEQWVRTRAWDMSRLTAITLRAEGIVEQDPDRLRTAADLLSLPSHGLERAQTLVELGAMLRRRKERASAREILRQALDIADALGPPGSPTLRARRSPPAAEHRTARGSAASSHLPQASCASRAWPRKE